jgi:hypothetical protein
LKCVRGVLLERLSTELPTPVLTLLQSPEKAPMPKVNSFLALLLAANPAPRAVLFARVALLERLSTELPTPVLTLLQSPEKAPMPKVNSFLVLLLAANCVPRAVLFAKDASAASCWTELRTLASTKPPSPEKAPTLKANSSLAK